MGDIKDIYLLKSMQKYVEPEELKKITREMTDFTGKLIQKLDKPHLQTELDINKIRGLIYGFCNGKITNQDKIRLNIIVREQIKRFLTGKSASRLDDLIKLKEDPNMFIERISQFWEKYQNYVFALKTVTEKMSIFFSTYNKMQEKTRASSLELEVQSVAVIAVNELQQYLKQKKILELYAAIFSDFIHKERKGLFVPRQKIKDSVQFFQSSFFDCDADCIRISGKVCIKKTVNPHSQPHRHSTAEKFFEKHILGGLLSDCKIYYQRFVNEQALTMNASDQIGLVLKYIGEETLRGRYYIHEQKNFSQYMQCFYKTIIELRLHERLQKPQGLKKYLQKFDISTNDCKEELENCWKIYSRVFQIAEQPMKKIYTQYLVNEGKSISQEIGKPDVFISRCVALNKKNTRIVQIFGKQLTFDRIRVEVMQKILSSSLVETTKKRDGSMEQGSNHTATIFHGKIKAKYIAQTKFGEEEEDLLKIFSILRYKMRFLKEYTKFLSTRLLEELDMSKVTLFSNAIALETKIIDEMNKDLSQNDVKSLKICLKDIAKSEEIFTNLKANAEYGKKYHFLKQLIIKNNLYWHETPFFEVKPPVVFSSCINDTLSELKKDGNVQFQLFNGVSTFRATIGKNKYTFSLNNLYVLILFSIDEKLNKKMFFNEILDQITPAGRLKDRADVDLKRCLIELTVAGLLRSNKGMGPGDKDLAKFDAPHYFQINDKFDPEKLRGKKAVVKKKFILQALQKHHKETFSEMLSKTGTGQKQMQSLRKFKAEAAIVKMLKHAHTQKDPNGQKGIITFGDLQKQFQTDKRLYELNADTKYLKQCVEGLIFRNFCERVQNKKNQLRYKA